jgi:hypothetical protein
MKEMVLSAMSHGLLPHLNENAEGNLQGIIKN